MIQSYRQDGLDQIVQMHHSREGALSLHYLLIYSIVYGLETELAFEFGSGGSTKVILEALKRTNGNLISCNIVSKQELLPDTDDIHLTYLHMPSEEALKRIDNLVFDFVLHDGAHDARTVAADLKIIAPKIKQFGILLVHDTQQSKLDEMREGVIQGLKGVRYSMTTLPYADGLTIIRIEGNEQNGRIKLNIPSSVHGNNTKMVSFGNIS
jgi:predicted O-methyltransferase YrrM